MRKQMWSVDAVARLLMTLYDIMVHYIKSRPKLAVQAPPRLCPKCGSHRTEIVGWSTDEKTVVVGCARCGERSKVPADTDVSVSNR